MATKERPYPGHVISAMSEADQWGFTGGKPPRPTLGFSYGMSREKQLAWIDKHYRGKGKRVVRQAPRAARVEPVAVAAERVAAPVAAHVVAEREAREKGDVFVSSYRNRRGVERVSLNFSAELADTVLALLAREGLSITKGRDAA